MTRPIWLIEGDVYGPEVEPLAAEIRRQGMVCQFVRYRELVKGPLPLVGGTPLGPDDRVIFYGTYPSMRHIQIHHCWIPGGWCSPENLDCGCYYTHFAQFLLNHRHTITTGEDSIRRSDELFEEFGEGGEVFARPTGVHKLFVGRRVSRDTFATALAPTRYDPATTVLIARPREIGREWRLVIAADQIVAGSQYAKTGARAIRPGCPDAVVDFVRTVLATVRWRPDDLFMMDVGESDGGLVVIELNSFSCSWLYACDFRAVVAAASRLADGE
jgi:hypothetical protein